MGAGRGNECPILGNNLTVSRNVEDGVPYPSDPENLASGINLRLAHSHSVYPRKES